ncbi:MAG: mechanosensitive ion channel [Ignavibacteria bacterium]|nr:mechanosensitive ion channel [Ignavibacteria bacterium]
MFYKIVYPLISFFFAVIIWLNIDSSQAPKILKDLSLVFVMVAAVTSIIGIVFKQPLTGFWAASSVTALVLGYALRNMILDLFSGIAINIEKPYKIGDWIEIQQKLALEKAIGEVIEIGWRATHIRAENNTFLVIPNSIISTMVIINNFWQDTAETRFEIYFTLDFSVPPEKAKRVILAGVVEAIERNGFVKEKFPQVLIEKTSDLGVTYKARYWIKAWKGISPSQASDEVNSKVLKHIWHAGISLAYPKEDIYYEKMPRRHLDDDLIQDRIALISKIDLFSNLNLDEKENISSSMIRKNFKKSDMIVNHGEEGNSMFILIEGLLEVLVMDHKNEMVLVSHITPSQHFGEMSLLTGELRSASIRAAVDSLVFEITKECFSNLLASREEIIEIIGTKITERKVMNDRLLNLLKDEEVILNKNGYKKTIIGKIRQFFGVSGSMASNNTI